MTFTARVLVLCFAQAQLPISTIDIIDICDNFTKNYVFSVTPLPFNDCLATLFHLDVYLNAGYTEFSNKILAHKNFQIRKTITDVDLPAMKISRGLHQLYGPRVQGVWIQSSGGRQFLRCLRFCVTIFCYPRRSLKLKNFRVSRSRRWFFRLENFRL